MRSLGSLLACSLVSASLVTACAPADDPPLAQSTSQNTDSTGVTDSSGTTSSDETASDDEGEGTGGEDCSQLECGPGIGIDNPDETARATEPCVCDCTQQDGYINDPETGECIVDESCVSIREVDCRTSVEEGSAVGMMFSLTYCNGDPKTDLSIEDIILEEQQQTTEDWEALLPSESAATIVEREALHHVYLIIDVSQSVKDNGLLDELQTGITTFFSELDAQGDPVRVAVFLFDGKYELYPFVPDTDDFSAASAAIADLAGFTGDDPMSTNLYGAVINGIRELDRAQFKRKTASRRGLLTTGTVVIVSDGDDEAGRKTLQQVQNEIDGTKSNIMTMGLGAADDYPTLIELGRDGPLQANTPEMIESAFSVLASRVDDFTDSTFFLGYCSPKRGDTAQVRARFKDAAMGTAQEEVVCAFDATFFADGCSADVFDPAIACAARDCGALVGCGTCGEGEGCVVDQCAAVSSRRFLAADEISNQQLWCEPGLHTPVEGGLCDQVAAGAGEVCDAMTPCDEPAYYCDVPVDQTQGTCEPTSNEGAPCVVDGQCSSLVCAPDPNDPLAVNKICHPMPRYGEPCTHRCADGTHCEGGTCKVDQLAYTGCSNPGYCRSGECFTFPNNATVCVPGDKAFYDDTM